jgi:hypothetical protein
MARFEVREYDPRKSDNPMALDMVAANDRWRILFRVYDNDTGRVLPFGQYRSRERAEARVEREEAKAAPPADQNEQEDR